MTSGTPQLPALLNVEHEGRSYRDVSAAWLAECGVPADVVLAAIKASLKAQVDAQAESLRLAVLTPGSGQAMEYQQASADALEVLKLAAPPANARYPMLAASIGIDIDPDTGAPATDVVGVARSVLAASNAWLIFGAAIRRVRLETKAAVDAGGTIAAAVAAAASAAWPSSP